MEDNFQVQDKVLYDDFICFISEITINKYVLIDEDGRLHDSIHQGDCWLMELIEKNSPDFPKIILERDEKVVVIKESKDDNSPEIIEINGVRYIRQD